MPTAQIAKIQLASNLGTLSPEILEGGLRFFAASPRPGSSPQIRTSDGRHLYPVPRNQTVVVEAAIRCDGKTVCASIEFTLNNGVLHGKLIVVNDAHRPSLEAVNAICDEITSQTGARLQDNCTVAVRFKPSSSDGTLEFWFE